MKDDRLYLIHIREAMGRIERFTKGGIKKFLESELVQNAVVYCLQTLAESTQRLSEAFKKSHPELDWQGMAGFRNVLVHGYLSIDLPRVWKVIEEDLPDLKRKLQPVFQTLPVSPESLVAKAKRVKKRSRKRKS